MIPWIGFLIGGLWMVNTLRMNRIGRYLRDKIAERVNALLQIDPETCNTDAYKVLEWESSPERLMFKWERRLLEHGMYLFSFVAPGVAAQVLIWKESKTPTKLSYPLWF